YKCKVMAARTHFDEFLGMDHFLTEDEAVSFMFYHVLDPAVCIYECPVRVFKECVNLPKRMDLVLELEDEAELAKDVPAVQPQELWQRLHPVKSNGKNGRLPPLVVDVREPREYRQHHIPEAELHPLTEILTGKAELPKDREIVLVCRTSRRSRRAAAALRKQGYTKLSYLKDGITGWENANLLEAVE
ncbi:MAG TPA: rhodanese-like domain-containing protein, partial [Anaerolineae bacterium]|nr:rhodanese-like domain-containing protein [Anaerolineae bacterium]